MAPQRRDDAVRRRRLRRPAHASASRATSDATATTSRSAAEHILIAVGTEPARPANVPFTPGRVIDSNELLELAELPQSMIIVGGGVIGTEYACMLAAVGVQVTLVDSRPAAARVRRRRDRRDPPVPPARHGHPPAARRIGREDRAGRRRPSSRRRWRATRRCRAQTLLYAIGRQGATGELNLAAAGLERRQPRAAEGQRVLPDRRPAHLRRRRRDRLPRAGRDEHGAGPAGGVPHVPADRRGRRARCSRTASTRSPRSAWSARPSRR